MATDHNFKVKNGLNVEGAGLTIVADGSESRVTSGGEIRFRPEGSSSNKVRLTLNTVQVQGNVNTTTGYQVDGSNAIDGSGNWVGGTLTSTSLDINGNAAVSGYLNFDGGDQNGLLRIGGSNVIGKSNNFLYIDPNNSFSSGIYINNQLKVDGGLISSYNEDLQLRAAGTTVLTLSNTDSSASFVGDVDVAGDLDVTGDLNITGDINSVSVTDLDVLDKTITLGVGQSAANSTGSGIVISGSNAELKWDNSDNRWEFNKDIFTSGNIDLGNNTIYASGDGNSIHLNAPTAIIGPSTTTASNPSLGLSTYRWNGLFSSTGSFSGTLTVAGQSTLARPVLVNGAHDNGGKADFAVDGGMQISLYDGQVQAGGTDMNWSAKFFHDSSGGHVAVWDNNLEFFTQGSNTGSATARDIIFSPQIGGTAAATERVRIKGATGNVGIGTSAPVSKLHVAGKAFIGDVSTTESEFPSSTASMHIHEIVDDASGVDLGNEAHIVISTGAVQTGAQGYTGSLWFGSSDYPAAGTGNDNQFVWRSAGIASTTGTTDTGANAAAGNLEFYTNNNSSGGSLRMTIAPDGDVGINEANPAQKLQVNGNIRADGHYYVGGTIAVTSGRIFRSADGTVSAPGYTFHSDQDTGMYLASAGRLKFTTAGSDILDLLNSGSTLSAPLTTTGNMTIDIADGGGSPAMTALFRLKGYEGRGAGIKIQDNVNSASGASNREWFIGSGYNQSGFNIGYASDGSQSSYAAQNKFRLDTSGNATFYGDIYAVDTNSSSNPSITFVGHTDTGLSIQDDGSADRLNFLTDGVTRAYVNVSGLFSQGNLYSGNNSDFRNYGGEWHATTGLTGNGFRFTNTADSVDALVLTAAGNATFAGTLETTGGVTHNVSATSDEVMVKVTNDSGHRNALTLNHEYDRDIGIHFHTSGGDYEVWIDSAGDDSLILSPGTTGNPALELYQNKDAQFYGNVEVPVDGTNFILNSDTTSREAIDFRQSNTQKWTLDINANGDLNFVPKDNDLLKYNGNELATKSYVTGLGYLTSSSGLNASNLTSGTIPSARFPDNIFDSYRRDTIDSSSEDFNDYLTTGTYAVNNWSESGDTVANGPTNTTAGGAYPWGILRVTNWQAASGSSSGTGTYVLQEYWPHQTDIVYSRIMWNGSFTGWRAAWGNENDGSGSGLDADLLDNLQSTSFLRSDAADTASHPITFSDRVNLHEIRSNTGQEVIINAGESASYATGQTGEYLYVNADTGFQVNVSPDNWSSAWAGRKTLSYDATNGLVMSGGFSVDASGNLSATTKSFDIEHPTKEGMRLRYGVLEGPENGVYVRGRTKGSVIQLPDHWTGLVHEDSITVQLTPIGKSSELYVKDIADNKVLVSNDTEYFYYIMAERKDVERFEVEYES